MSIWYWLCDILPIEMLHWDFMKNALLAIIIMAPLFGLLSTMVVTGRMSFFSDALGHSAFTGIAIGAICGMAAAMKDACEKNGIQFYYPSPIFCTDNAAMIGVAAYYEYMAGVRDGLDLNANPSLRLGDR